MSELEHASIAAFAILESELRALGADEGLLERCSSAREDEIRHAEVAGALARQYGSTIGIRLSTVAPARTRSVIEIAIENAVEGCVNETYAAALAIHSGIHAFDPTVRETMRAIGQDETRHAELSWDVFDFLHGLLTPVERQEVREAMTRAVTALASQPTTVLPAELERLVGLPATPSAGALRKGLETNLWNA